jgi:hypothetical protein
MPVAAQLQVLAVIVKPIQRKRTKTKIKIDNKMAKQVFINLAVTDLQKSMDFYTALGFTNNPQFSDDTAKCMV